MGGIRYLVLCTLLLVALGQEVRTFQKKTHFVSTPAIRTKSSKLARTRADLCP